MNKMELYKCPRAPSLFYTASMSLIFNTDKLLTKSGNLNLRFNFPMENNIIAVCPYGNTYAY